MKYTYAEFVENAFYFQLRPLFGSSPLNIRRVFSKIVFVCWQVIGFNLISVFSSHAVFSFSSSYTVFPLTSVATLGIPNEISASLLISAASLHAVLIRIVPTLCQKLNQNAYGPSVQTILLIFRFLYYIWFIDSENLCFIFFICILKKKLTRC